MTTSRTDRDAAIAAFHRLDKEPQLLPAAERDITRHLLAEFIRQSPRKVALINGPGAIAELRNRVLIALVEHSPAPGALRKTARWLTEVQDDESLREEWEVSFDSDPESEELLLRWILGSILRWHGARPVQYNRCEQLVAQALERQDKLTA